MGWFKRLFEKIAYETTEEQKPAEQSIEIDVLPKWLDDRLNDDFSKIKSNVLMQFTKFMDEKHQLLVNLEELKMAELVNPNISEREKQIMEGNRTSYISQHKQFINMLNLSDDITCKETAAFCRNFEDLLLKLAKSTAKGQAIMNEFFADNVRKVNTNIKAMSDYVSKIQEILEDGNIGIDVIDDVRRAAAELQLKQKSAKEVGTELAVLRKKLENSNFLRDKIVRHREELKGQESYIEFSTANQKREELWKKIKQLDDEALNLFSPLQRAMKKFEYMIVEDSKLFVKYMDNPLSALLDDETLKIIDIFAKMKIQIASGSIELKDPDKVIIRIDEITKERLSVLRESYSESKQAVKAIDDQIRNSNVMQELNDNQYKIEHTETQIKILQDKLEKAEKTNEKIDMHELRGIVQEKIREAFGIRVDIICKNTEPDLSSLLQE